MFSTDQAFRELEAELNKPTPLEQELQAMQQIVVLLEPLPAATQQRVASWIAQRCADETKPPRIGF